VKMPVKKRRVSLLADGENRRRLGFQAIVQDAR